MSASRYVSRVVLAGALAWCSGAFGGFDHKVPFDESGIWDRDVQKGVQYTTIAVILGSALWEGGETPLGRTSWQAVDSTIIGAVTSEAAKRIFSRARPSQTDDPGKWFEGSGNESFPSGEVTLVSAAVAPFVFEYAKESPWVWALELLPLYDSVARVKSQAHWQTDVIAGWALGTAAGYVAHAHGPFILQVLPHEFVVGIHQQW